MRSQIEHQEKLLRRRNGATLEQAASGGGGHTVPGGIQETWRDGASLKDTVSG